MSTRINISADGLIALKQQADKVSELNQQSAVQKEDEKKLAKAERLERSRSNFRELADRFGQNRSDRAAASKQEPMPAPAGQPMDQNGRKRNDVPTTELVRELSAQRFGEPLVPFAISWRGAITYQAPRIWSGTVFPEAGFTTTSTVTYYGGDYAETGPYQIAAGKDLISITQPVRYTEWRSVPKLCTTVCGPSTWVYEGWWAESITASFTSGAPGASISNPVTLTTEFDAAPPSNGPTGPISHGADLNYLAVGTDGTIFVIAMLPWEPISITTEALQREVYLANPGTSSPYNVDGQQQKVAATGLYNGNAVRTGYPSKPLYQFSDGQPVLFMRIKNGKVSSKTALYDPTTSFVPFYQANAYSDDPGKNLRNTYAGEVRVRNNQAHKLRMRYQEVFEGDTYVWYEDFPYLSLTGFITGTGSKAKLNAGVTFEDHIYNLDPYNTDAELAAQLGAIVNPTGYQDQPEYLPDRVQKLSISPSFVAQAAKQISTEGADVLTPLTYFVAMP